MDWNGMEWLSLAVRWLHVFTGILWIGTTYYFTWLDHRFGEALAAVEKGGAPAQVWMVHSGGFYVVEKRTKPDLGTHHLHWFKYEALFTGLSGLAMLTIVYYMGPTLLDPSKTTLTHGWAVAVGVGSLFAAWIVYDAIWMSPIGKNGYAGAAICFAVAMAAAWGLSHVFSNRAMYIHIGGMFGTIMALNVWERILPAQRQLVAAVKSGGTPDATLAARAKGRSKHNTYIIVPTVLIMISNHYPIATYGNEQNLLVLAGLILGGWVIAKLVYHGPL